MRDNPSVAGSGGKAMDEMAKHGNGTYDADKKQWKVRTKELKASATIRRSLPRCSGRTCPTTSGKPARTG